MKNLSSVTFEASKVTKNAYLCELAPPTSASLKQHTDEMEFSFYALQSNDVVYIKILSLSREALNTIHY